MSYYKEEMIQMLDQEGQTLQDSVQKVFMQGLAHAKVTGQSLESIVYEMFEGLESSKGNETLLIQSADVIAQLLLQYARKEMAHSYQIYRIAYARHQETIEKQYAFVEELLETLTLYARDHGYEKLGENCRKKKVLLLAHMDEISVKVRYNHGLNIQKKETHGQDSTGASSGI